MLQVPTALGDAVGKRQRHARVVGPFTGRQPMWSAATIVRYRLERARPHELDGGTQRVTDSQAEQSAASSIQAKIRAPTHATDRIRVCRRFGRSRIGDVGLPAVCGRGDVHRRHRVN